MRDGGRVPWCKHGLGCRAKMVGMPRDLAKGEYFMPSAS